MKLNKKEKKKIGSNILKNIKVKSAINNAKDKFSDFLEIPQEIVSNYTKITSIEDTDILIEGYKKIVDYYDNYIKIKTNNMYLVIDGSNLDIKEITDSELVISGKIYSLNYKKN
ncbi:MAG: YabP/YqfC family sporulation protein [Clostridia bacterium]|nr:YabP/YqfC family sporulation protein [Clostridia bacterium]